MTRKSSKRSNSKRRDSIQERTNSDGSTTYRAQVRIRGHAPLSKSFTRRTDAKRWIEESKVAMRNGSALSTEAERTTLKEALERYLREVTPKKKGKAREANRVKAWMKHPLGVRFLSQLGNASNEFAKHRDELLADGKAWSTIRSELLLISGLFEVARREWGMGSLRNPIKNVRLPSKKSHGSNERNRRLEVDEEQRLLAQLKILGPYYAPLVELAIETGMRQGELLSITFGDVNLDTRVAKLRDTKNSEPRDVPLSSRAIEVIRSVPRPLSSAAPVIAVGANNVARAFRTACAAAGIENLRFHDLRHEGVSRLFERGLALPEVAAVSGHKTWSQLKRYTNLRARDLARKLA